MIEDRLIDFINRSPTCFNVVRNVEVELLSNGFIALDEKSDYKLEKGKKYFVTRNNSSLIAFVVGKNINDDYTFNVVASHTDSPCFKIKPNSDSKSDIYNKVNIEPYGGMINSTWLDRPLSVAGRVIFEKDNKVVNKIINIDKPCLMIPNICIHFNRQINNGYVYNYNNDLQPFSSQDDVLISVLDLVSENLNISRDKIINFDLFVYNNEKGYLWGTDNEFISSSRLDDLEGVFVSKESFMNSVNDDRINVVAFFNNEEVGSLSMQGASSDFFVTTLKRINNALMYSEDVFMQAVSKSYLISLDNAHCVHPNNVCLIDMNNKVYMNKGIVIKFNASERYTSDGLSSSIMQKLCQNSNVPYQFYTNRSDILGGSTLGNISNNQISFRSVDIGLGQLAMHSSFETSGSKDVKYLFDMLSYFYSSKIVFESDNSFYIE